MKFILPVASFLALNLLSCNNAAKEGVNTHKPGKKDIEALNSYMVEKDRERIQGYIERKSIEMKESSSGLWYKIINEGSGRFFKDFDRIVIDYKCSLLDGTLCYSSDKLGPKEIVLGGSELEPGLNEGLRMLKPGGEALFIMPPFLGYGIIGDNRAIPPRSVLVYEIKILNK